MYRRGLWQFSREAHPRTSVRLEIRSLTYGGVI